MTNDVTPSTIAVARKLSDARGEEDVVAKTTVTFLICDRCRAETGEDVEAEESVGFGYEGYGYALDLCAPHAKEFHNSIQAMIEWSSERSRLVTQRRSGRATPSRASQPEPDPVRGRTGDRERLRTLREWARNNGYPELGSRGRIPQHIVAEYEAAQHQ